MRSIKEMSSLQGRTALVTGGAGYLGRTFGETLAELGASVALADRHGDAAKKAAADLEKNYGIKALDIEIDLADHESRSQLPGEVANQLGGLDILINAAGFVQTDDLKGWTVPFEEQRVETWRAALEVNLTAPFFLTQAALPWLRANKKGTVINITSLYAFLGPDMRLYADTEMGNAGGYSASKGGLLQITRWLATVLAPDVRVNCVSPGGVWRNQPEPFVKRFESRTPMKRMQKEEDLKGIIAYLASDMSEYVTGQHFPVEGGWSAW